MIISKAQLSNASTKKGGYTAKQIKMAQDVFPGKWKKKMAGATVSELFWSEFVLAGKKQKKVKPIKPKVINKVSTNKKDDWSWRPANTDIPDVKITQSKGNKNKGKKKAKRNRVSRFNNDKFYESREWRELRVRVLEKYECKCMMCGRSPKEHGIVIHCDHIKPRSKRPELSLTFDNLQLLCADCNLGKSNKYSTDWRPDVDEITEILDNETLANSPLD